MCTRLSLSFCVQILIERAEAYSFPPIFFVSLYLICSVFCSSENAILCQCFELIQTCSKIASKAAFCFILFCSFERMSFVWHIMENMLHLNGKIKQNAQISGPADWELPYTVASFLAFPGCRFTLQPDAVYRLTRRSFIRSFVRSFTPPFSFIQFYYLNQPNWKSLIWIKQNEKKAQQNPTAIKVKTFSHLYISDFECCSRAYLIRP